MVNEVASGTAGWEGYDWVVWHLAEPYIIHS